MGRGTGREWGNGSGSGGVGVERLFCGHNGGFGADHVPSKSCLCLWQ